MAVRPRNDERAKGGATIRVKRSAAIQEVLWGGKSWRPRTRTTPRGHRARSAEVPYWSDSTSSAPSTSGEREPAEQGQRRRRTPLLSATESLLKTPPDRGRTWAYPMSPQTALRRLGATWQDFATHRREVQFGDWRRPAGFEAEAAGGPRYCSRVGSTNGGASGDPTGQAGCDRGHSLAGVSSA
jgi:hypothetical protein